MLPNQTAVNNQHQEGFRKSVIDLLMEDCFGFDQDETFSDEEPVVELEETVTYITIDEEESVGKEVITIDDINDNEVKTPLPKVGVPRRVSKKLSEIFKSKPIKVNESRKRKARCGICEGCTREDCGECKFCKDKLKFGGPQKMKQACVLKKCPQTGIRVKKLSSKMIDNKKIYRKIDIERKRKSDKKSKIDKLRKKIVLVTQTKIEKKKIEESESKKRISDEKFDNKNENRKMEIEKKKVDRKAKFEKIRKLYLAKKKLDKEKKIGKKESKSKVDKQKVIKKKAKEKKEVAKTIIDEDNVNFENDVDQDDHFFFEYSINNNKKSPLKMKRKKVQSSFNNNDHDKLKKGTIVSGLSKLNASEGIKKDSQDKSPITHHIDSLKVNVENISDQFYQDRKNFFQLYKSMIESYKQNVLSSINQNIN